MTMIRRRNRQFGIAMIEMVAITPVMLLLLLGIAELGKAFIQYNTLNKGVRDAARFVAGTALLGTTGTVFITPDIATGARNLAVYGIPVASGSPRLQNFQTSHVGVTDAGNGHILVRADYPYVPLTGPVLQTFGFGEEPSLTFTLTATVTMRAL